MQNSAVAYQDSLPIIGKAAIAGKKAAIAGKKAAIAGKKERPPPFKRKVISREHYLGHRKRLREKLNSNAESLLDYELLEMMVAYSQPRVDTKALAKSLLIEYETLANVLNAESHELQQFENLGVMTTTFFKLVREVNRRCHQITLRRTSVLSSWNQLIDYCKTHMIYSDIECLHGLFLANDNSLLKDEVIHRGTIDTLSVFPREIFKVAFRIGATSIILVHNHPSGDPAPSEADIKTTVHIKKLAQQLGLHFHDHLIIGAGKFVSLKNEGWL